MTDLISRIRKMNADLNDLPRRIALIAAVLLGVYILFLVIGYVAPFAVALVFAWAITPFARLLERGCRKIKIPGKIGSLLAVILLYGVIITIVILVGARVIEELKSLISVLPGMAKQLSDYIQNIRADGLFGLNIADEQLLKLIGELLTSLLNQVSSFASMAVTRLARFTFDIAMSLPKYVLFVVISIIGTFYLVADRERIFSFFKRWTPERFAKRFFSLRASVFKSISGQVLAALTMMVLIMIELSIGFTIMQIPYAFTLAVLIGVADALPIIGAGLFLIPMSLYGLIFGDLTLGLGAALLYGIAIVMRQIVEPRIVSYRLGLYPLATLTAMYAGLRLVGFVGMFLGPMLMLILKVMLTGEPAAKPSPKPKRIKKTKERAS